MGGCICFRRGKLSHAPLWLIRQETGLQYSRSKRDLCEQLYDITSAIDSGDLSPAIQYVTLPLELTYRWCEANASFLSSPPHPSSLPYHLHRAVFLSLSPASSALQYARHNLMTYVPTHPVLQLITSALYTGRTPYTHETYPLSQMFQAEFCRRHGMPKEELLEVAVDLGGRGGALGVIEKARRVMGDRLGNVRTWQDLPVSILILSANTIFCSF